MLRGHSETLAPGQRSVAQKAETVVAKAYNESVFRAVIAACALILATSVLAGCGGLSPQQRVARREATQMLTFLHLGYAHPKVTSIDIRGGDWAVIVLQGHFTVPNNGCLPGTTSCPPGRALRARLGFALRDPRHSWNMGYDLGHGF